MEISRRANLGFRNCNSEEFIQLEIYYSFTKHYIGDWEEPRLFLKQATIKPGFSMSDGSDAAVQLWECPMVVPDGNASDLDLYEGQCK